LAQLMGFRQDLVNSLLAGLGWLNQQAGIFIE